MRAIQDILESWAPPDIAWERDNVGLQVGDPDAPVKGILVALDVTEGVVAEAARRGTNLIVSHHPLLFRPLHSVTTRDAGGRCVTALARKRIAVYSAHTNLDFTRGGTSFALADALGLKRQAFLRTTYRLQTKIVTFVPPSHLDAVAGAMAGAGAGIIGHYDHCSFRSEGTGTFRGGMGTHPAAGLPGVLERVPEVRLEMVAPRRSVHNVVRAMIAAHPYEEVAYDVYPLETVNREYGMGVIGELSRGEPLSRFLRRVRNSLNAAAPRYAGDPRSRVRRIAVCGGSGGELLEDAIGAGADLFLTADVKYHTFQEAEGRIALVDGGHFETEFPVVAAVVQRLRRETARRGARFPVRAATRSTNPVRRSVE